MPIPQRRDAEISSLLRAWLELDEPTRKAALSQLPSDCRFTLLGYSERMASLAVRDRNKEHVLLGLLALGLDGWRDDWRDNVLVVCLHYDAAKRIGLRPNDLFEQAAALLPEKPAIALRSFLRRSEEDKSLEAMGYAVALTPTDSVTRGRGNPLVRPRGIAELLPFFCPLIFQSESGSYCGLTVKSIDDWPTLWPSVSSIVNCKV